MDESAKTKAGASGEASVLASGNVAAPADGHPVSKSGLTPAEAAAIGIVLVIATVGAIARVVRKKKPMFVVVMWLVDALAIGAIEVMLCFALQVWLPDAKWIQDFVSGSKPVIFITFLWCAGVMVWFLCRSFFSDEEF